jgi:hypothetical protein
MRGLLGRSGGGNWLIEPNAGDQGDKTKRPAEHKIQTTYF